MPKISYIHALFRYQKQMTHPGTTCIDEIPKACDSSECTIPAPQIWQKKCGLSFFWILNFLWNLLSLNIEMCAFGNFGGFCKKDACIWKIRAFERCLHHRRSHFFRLSYTGQCAGCACCATAACPPAHPIFRMHVSGASNGPKFQINRRAVGTECQGCGKMCFHLFAHYQHRHSPTSRNSSCNFIQHRSDMAAVPRANMSTAAVERCHRSCWAPTGTAHARWRTILHILPITHIPQIPHIKHISNGAYPQLGPAAGWPIRDFIFVILFSYFQFFVIWRGWGGGYIFLIFFAIFYIDISKAGST